MIYITSRKTKELFLKFKQTKASTLKKIHQLKQSLQVIIDSNHE